MESSGIPGEVNISQETFEKIKDFFICDYRGKIKAKNKGEIDMYLVKKKLEKVYMILKTN
ncbi:adenylate/guanylate cyclase catalytic domain protein [Leptospira interrogans str. L1207]|nr:adenylate/guanylate cyclase catalytic domain protein [Leptospira interrogans str. L1207]